MDAKTTGNTLAEFSQNVHPCCVVCSSENEKGLCLQFNATSKGGVEARFRCSDVLQGYPGMAHGGIVTAILDGAMCNCLFACGRAAVTAEMKTRFRHSLALGKEAKVTAETTKVSRRVFKLKSKIIQDGKIIANAEATYYDEKPK